MRRVVHLLLAGCIVLSALLALRHETAVAHVHGVLSGEVEHAHALAEYHELDTTPHLHGRHVDAHAEAGACALLAALDHSTILPGTPADSTATEPAALTAIALVDADAPPHALFRLAPKTSPPALI